MVVHITDTHTHTPTNTHVQYYEHTLTHSAPASSNKGERSRPQYTLRPIKHGDLPPPGFVRHQLPTMCWREETPAPEQKIYSSITIHPDMNILPLHFHTARRIIPLTENKCIIRGGSMWSFKVSAQFYSGVVSVPTPRSPAALTLKRPRFL